MLLNNQWVTEKIKEEIKKKIPEGKENGTITTQSFIIATIKAILKGKYKGL